MRQQTQVEAAQEVETWTTGRYVLGMTKRREYELMRRLRGMAMMQARSWRWTMLMLKECPSRMG